MKNINEYLSSGILEQYVLGLTTVQENADIDELSKENEVIRKEIDEISEALVKYSSNNVVIDPTIKPMLMATVEYMERIKNGELATFPPTLNENSKVVDFTPWLNREDISLPSDFEDFYAKIIGLSPEKTTAVAWLKYGSPVETHSSEYEKFLILEGTCDITIDEKIISLVPGDYLSIPLHSSHFVKVTSSIPCKVILQRIAA